MKRSTKDQSGGKAHELKGKLKKKAGKTTDDPNLQEEGKDEEAAGKVELKQARKAAVEL